LLTNGNMETGDPPSSWIAANSVLAAESTIIHSGSKSIKVTPSADWGLAQQSVSVSVGQWVTAISAIYSNTPTKGILFQLQEAGGSSAYLCQSSTTLSEWKYLSKTGRVISAVSGVYARFQCFSNTFIGYGDSASVKILSTPSLFRLVRFATPYGIAKGSWSLLSGLQCGVVMCLDNPANPQNFVICYHNCTNLYLDKCVAGTYTNLITTATAYGAGRYVEIRRAGSSNVFQAFYNGSQVGTDQTISDATIITNKYHGLFSTDASNTCADFSFIGA
jgi:hypothetical protein